MASDNIEQALVVYLLSKSAITDIIGTKLFPVGGVPSNIDYPLITYQLVRGRRNNVLDASCVQRLANDTYQFKCLSHSTAEAKALCELLRGYFERQGTTPVMYDNVPVQLARVEEESQLANDPVRNEEVGIMGRMLLVTFWYTEV